MLTEIYGQNDFVSIYLDKTKLIDVVYSLTGW